LKFANGLGLPRLDILELEEGRTEPTAWRIPPHPAIVEPRIPVPDHPTVRRRPARAFKQEARQDKPIKRFASEIEGATAP